MQKSYGRVRRRVISARVSGFVTVMVACAMGAGMAHAQVSHDTGAEAGAKAEVQGQRSYETLYLNGAMTDNEAVDVLVDLRNMLPQAKVYFVQPQRAISLYGSAEDIALAKQVLAGVNRAMKSYRLTYTLTETGGGQAAATRRVSMLVASGGSAEVKQGTRVPVMTGSSDPGNKTQNDQVQYLDVGLQIKAKLEGGQGHVRLQTALADSAVGSEQTNPPDPLILQTSMDVTVTLEAGKTVSLGSLDIPANGRSGARHMTIEVTAEPAG